MTEGRRQMVALCEFEIFRDRQGLFRAVPFGLSASDISGRNYRECCEQAVAWLKAEADARVDTGESLPELPLGNYPKSGGRIVLAALEPTEREVRVVYQAQAPTTTERPASVSASRAAELLGVSRSRISQMTKDGTLEGFREGRDAYVTIASLNAYINKPARKSRSKAIAIQLSLF